MTFKKILLTILTTVILLLTNKIYAQSDVWFVGNNISIDLVKELNSLYNLISLNFNEDKLEKFLDNTKFLFKGYSGVGINYFICKKN